MAPIVFFAYNRPDHTRRSLEALQKNPEAANSFLRIYIDGPKANASAETIANIKAVRNVAAEKQWCGRVEIIASPENKGLFSSISSGITNTINEFGRIIVLEDDVLVSPGFLAYMNEALELYEQTPEVMHISGYSRPQFNSAGLEDATYFFYHTSCWGWATWKRAWDKFRPEPLALQKKLKEKGGIYQLNMDGTYEFYWGLKAIAEKRFQSWNYIWHSTVFLNDGLCLHPAQSLVSNIGHDGSGTNCSVDEGFASNDQLAEKIVLKRIPLKQNAQLRKIYRDSHSARYKFLFAIRHYLRFLKK
ncbi:MAG: methyltransferase FkbM family [Ferruginibacter sp.]|nr:methyltransferase FkbM family [Ferruginibacter sp.]